MEVLFIVIVVAALAWMWLAKSKRDRHSRTDSSPAQGLGYQKKKTFLSPAERSFYGVLKLAVGDEFEIFVKPRMADVLQPKSSTNRSEWQTAFNKIANKHFDYLLCCKETLKALHAIELDDRSHDEMSRVDRDSFVKKACDSAGLPLINVRAAQVYKAEELREMLGLVTAQESAGEVAVVS